MSCSSWVMMESFVEGLWWKELLVCREGSSRLRGYSSTSPSSRQSSVINIARYKVHPNRHVASQLAGNDRCDPPLAGAGFVIPARRCPPGLLDRLPIYTQLVSSIDDDNPPGRNRRQRKTRWRPPGSNTTSFTAVAGTLRCTALC